MHRKHPISTGHSLVSLAFSQDIAVLFQRTPVELRLLPQIRCQETICVSYSYEGSLKRVFESLGGA